MPILLLAWFFIWSGTAQAAPAPPITAGNTSSAFSNWKPSFSWQHTVSGDDPVLLVSLHGDGYYLEADSVNYAGQTMTLAAKKVYGAPYNNMAVYVYYLANPPQGQHDITVNMGWFFPFAASAITFNNCDTANPLGLAETFLGWSASLSHSVVTTKNNMMLVDAITYHLPDFFSLSPSAGQTGFFIQPQNSQWSGQTNPLYAGGSYRLAGETGTSTMGWLANGGDRTSVHIVVGLNPKYQSETKDPVIIVPGIMGSYLNRDDADKTEVWPNILKMLIPGDDSYLNELTMTTNGYPDLNNPRLMPTDIIRQIATDDYYQGLITELENNGYEENKNLFVFPYDWRWFLNWSAAEDPFSAIQSLKEKIDQVKSQTGARKVNIIAHSLGGLAAKYYLKHYGANSVGKFIDIGTPHLGAPKASKILMYGDNFDIKLGFYYPLNKDTIKNISQNMPSIYELLPSRNYFDSANPDYSYYLYDLYDLDNNGATGRLDYTQSIDFMKNTGRNNYLLGFNDVLHNDLDNYSPVSDGVKTYNIVGCGRPTIGQIFALNKEQSGKYEYGLKYISGDGTVPLRSAEAFIADDSYYVRGAEHGVLPSANGVKQITAAILKGTIGSFSLPDYPEMSHNSADCSLNGTQISFHSPIELNVYDENNNYVGPVQNGDIELGIEGAQYDDLDGNKFVFLPAGHNYRVVGQATDSGTFNARVQTVQNGQYIETTYYNQVPLNGTSTTAQLQTNNGQIVGAMELDQNGDQIFETQVEPSAVLNQAETADLVKPETQISLSGSLGNNDFYTSTTTATLTATDNQGGSGVLKTEDSLDNGQSWQNYQNPIVLTGDGEYSLLYKSTDRAGNIEKAKTQKLKIDKTAPTINILLPLDNQEFSHDEVFTPEYEIGDNYSGAATGSLEMLLDGQPISQPEQDLFYYSLGQHVLKITVSDLAGNQAEASVKFMVSADLDSTISDVNRSYSLGWISEKKVRNWLVQELNEIKKYQEKFGVRLNKLEQKREKIMNQCLKKKSQAWCEEKLKEHYDRAVYKLSQNYQKTIIKRYRQILKKLESYYRKQWLNQSAYDMIKEDVEYLISKL